MGELRGLTEQVLDQVLEQARDHAPALSDLASRLDPAASELIRAWESATRAALESQPWIAALEGSSETFGSWIAALKRGTLRAYFSAIAAWARALAVGGMPYDRSLALLREYQGRAVPLLIRVYPAGPELEAALSAFDDLFDGSAALAGAVYVDQVEQSAVGDARMQALAQVFGGATHALSNVFAAVLGRLEVLIEQMHTAEARDELLDIQQTAGAGALMVRRLQDFIRRDRVDAPTATQANHLMRDAAEITRFLWRDEAETRGVVIDVVQDFADVPPVQARPAALREAFVLLVVDAVRALPQGGLVTLRTERRGDLVLASVIYRRHAGEATRAQAPDISLGASHPVSRAAGLNAVAKIVAELDGSLTVETAPERGANYTLALPLAHGADIEKEKAAMSTQPANILLIDNEPSVRDAFDRLLSLYGHHVATAENGEKGVAAFRSAPFDVVFTDLGMPGMSGWDVAREIKKINPKALVVLVTGWPIDLNSKKAEETGVDRVVTKPLDMPQVLGLIDDAVALRGRT
ncbi:MAG: response regulator [Chloroflexota bacterium]|nr:response regulator [Chloroflexota bacterium]